MSAHTRTLTFDFVVPQELMPSVKVIRPYIITVSFSYTPDTEPPCIDWDSINYTMSWSLPDLLLKGGKLRALIVPAILNHIESMKEDSMPWDALTELSKVVDLKEKQ